MMQGSELVVRIKSHSESYRRVRKWIIYRWDKCRLCPGFRLGIKMKHLSNPGNFFNLLVKFPKLFRSGTLWCLGCTRT